MKLQSILAFAAIPAFAASFTIQNTAQRTPSALYAKGFDKNKPAPKKKSDGQIQREEKASRYDEVSATGGQEYNVFVRQFGGEDESWLPCGSIAVPRTAQVSDAIFENEEALKTAIIRTFPKLKGYEQEFEYGYNLKIYQDEPVEIAKKNMRSDGPSVGNWISNLLSPIDGSKSN